MRYYAYHRTSTKEQHLDRGIKAIEDFTKDKNINLEYLFTDQQTGKNFDRPQYLLMKKQMLKSIQNGNSVTLIVSELDRLGRNKELTLKEIRELKDRGVRLMVIEIPTTLQELPQSDTMAKMMMETINNMLIEMYASFAHAEMEKRAKRQREGIAAKKTRGEWTDYGRPRVLDLDTFSKYYKRVLDGELKPTEVMELLSINKSAYYRYRNEYETNE
ncbi:recombinase family protein [Clostridium sp.]|uniref:recombinase family protein n=1 Tax=Clostridium sp. TaxID=1506 RepID=UPI00321741B2